MRAPNPQTPAPADPAEPPCDCSRGEVLLCRCREVSRDEVLAAIDEGAQTLHDLKTRTHAMTGLCQGRTCRRELARELAAAGQDPAALLPRHARPPVRPVPLAALAASDGDAEPDPEPLP